MEQKKKRTNSTHESGERLLPPDPEQMNDARAGWAAAAIRTFQHETGTDLEDALSDLLADLMHWCDRNGQNFDAELSRGRYHYEAETDPDGEDCF